MKIDQRRAESSAENGQQRARSRQPLYQAAYSAVNLKLIMPIIGKKKPELVRPSLFALSASARYEHDQLCGSVLTSASPLRLLFLHLDV